MDVSFPGLWGLHFEIRRWAFEIFGLKIYWYGIIIALAFLAAVMLAVRSSRKFNLDPDNILDLVLFAAPAAIVGARLYYVILSWDQFKDNLLEVFNTRNGGLAIYGGVIGALIVAWIYSKKKKLSFLHIADFAMPYIALGQGIGRWGNFVNQEAYGTATTLPWRMNGSVPNEYLANLQQSLDPAKWGVHPTFLYESLLDIAVFAFLVLYRKKERVKGEVLMLYLALYGAGRFLIEGLRTDSLMLGNLRFSQILSLLLVIFGISMIVYLRLKNRREADVQPAEIGQSEYASVLQKMKDEEHEELDQASIETAGVAAPVESESGADGIGNEKPAE
jgi:phosphatidylglycerol:prolipoprotein diacylglycerol transferase